MTDLTVKILSGGAAALASPEAEDTSGREPCVTEKKPLVVTDNTFAEEAPRPAAARRSRGRRIGFMTAQLIQLAVCGALFAAAWAAQSLAPAEAHELLLGIIGKFA